MRQQVAWGLAIVLAAGGSAPAAGQGRQELDELRRELQELERRQH